MASSVNQLRFCSALSLTSRLSHTPSILPPRPPVAGSWTKPVAKPRLLADIPRPVFCVWAVTYDNAEVGVEEKDVERLKKTLIEAFDGTDRGLQAKRDERGEIVELINQLETLNPTPVPTDALTLLDGKWTLAYTSCASLFPFLAKATGPLFSVAKISQTIDSENFAVQNSVQIAFPLGTTAVGTNATFEVRSAKRVEVKIEEGVIGTPQLTDSLVIPDEVEILGHNIDLTPIKGILITIQDTADSVAKSISSQPPLKIPISRLHAQSWLLTTYLDEELRISRDDGGSVFVLIKEGSSLLSSS
ncbi:hypothetical protein RIF29_40766 [Crotalaria pallida]|uniref:Plastid lipid-associated protein/fibrillin conserved domain-containing protein n=1 Tax=Crotalaria pallida TaxID=3830 RepID=A0AAN9HRZ7_CROPI